jgi:glycosyltransferase involved in cell wall biosynthesis
LPENGYEVHVLSARNASAPVVDPGLLKLVPSVVRQHHAWTPVIPFSVAQDVWRFLNLSGRKPAAQESGAESGGNLIRRILTPDPEVLWRPFCFRKACHLIRCHNIDVVLITAPPFSAFLTGVALKKRFPHVALISDFRDGWLDWYIKAFDFFRYPSMHKKVERMECSVVETSDLAVSVTAVLMENLKIRYPKQPAGKFALIPNGFDPAVQTPAAAVQRRDGKVRVTYVGTLYGQTSARYYLNALDESPDEIRNGFESHFIGRIAAEEIATQQNRRSSVYVHGFVPQAEALRFLSESDVLLVNMTDPLCHTGKIFEYLGAGKPILAFTHPKGELAQLLSDVGGTWIVDPEDLEGARRVLAEVYSLCTSGAPRPAPDPARIQRFQRPLLTQRYAELIRGAIETARQSIR